MCLDEWGELSMIFITIMFSGDALHTRSTYARYARTLAAYEGVSTNALLEEKEVTQPSRAISG